MSDAIIKVENLGKKYIIGHQKQEKYTALRDVIGNSVKSIFKPNSKTRNTQEEFWALKDINFEINQGDRVGIIGRNGAGKSTLLKILSRITEPTKGQIKIKGRVASLLEVGTGFHPELTGRENIFLNGAILGMSRVEIKKKFDEIVAFAEVEKFLDTPVKRYSSGMYVRLAFAVAAHLEPEILIVDEVLAVGDAQFQKKCLGKMKDVGKEGRTVIFVSHNIGAISSLCNKGIYLNSGILKYQGTIQKSVDCYLKIHQSQNYDYPPGIIFREKLGKIELERDSFKIIEVSLLDRNYQPKPITKTWDHVKIRIRYYSPRNVDCGSVILEISTLTGTRLIQYSTSPLSGLSIFIKQGESYIDCVIPSLPLSAGSYNFGVGLAVPMVEWLCWEEHLATIEIASNDIYKSKFPPNQERTPLAIEHYWELYSK